MRRKTQDEFIKEVFDLVEDEYRVLGEYINSDTKIKMYHKKCNKEYLVTPGNFLRGNRCKCSFKQKKTQLKFEKEVFDLVQDKYSVLGEYKGNHTKLQFYHKKCCQTFQMTPHNFLTGNRCPVCNDHPTQTAIGFNSMWDTNPELAKLLLNPEDGYKYTQCSGKRVDWKCPECDFTIKNKKICNIHNYGLFCPRCKDGISYPNRLMFSILSNLHIDFKTEKLFKWCKYTINESIKQGKYDFYFIFDNQEYIIEMDGGWHWINNTINGLTKEDSLIIDIEKEKLARLHNIIPIRINSEHSTLYHIQSSIQYSILSNLFNLFDIDWQECDRDAKTSLKVQACKLWKVHCSTKKVSEIMKKGRNTIIRWLKFCNNEGMCDYNPDIERKKAEIKPRRVICINTNEIFESETEASKKYSIHQGTISNCCRGRLKYAGKLPDGTKLHWKYVD